MRAEAWPQTLMCSRASCQERKSILRRSGSEPPDRSTRVKFNPLALLLDASLEGEYDLVQRVIYDVSRSSCWRSLCFPLTNQVFPLGVWCGVHS